MFHSLFSLSLHYDRLISIICSYCFLFSHYCSISIIVLVIHKNKTHIPVYSHFVVVAAIHFISFLFQTLTLNSFSFSYFQSTILMSIFISNFIVVAILICLVVCWKWIDNSIQNRHRFNPSIMHLRGRNKSK